jgi:hypothetical protein
MGRGLKWISGIYILSILVSGCKSHDSSAFLLGNDLTGPPNSTIVEIDTCTVHLSTMKEDSIATSNHSKLLIGYFSDGKLGTIKCSTVFSLGLPAERGIGSTDEFDSMRLSLRFWGDYYGDTTKPQTITVYQITDYIRFPDGSNMFNTSRTRYDSRPSKILGSLTWQPHVTSGNTVSINIDDFGKYIFGQFRDHPNDFTTDEPFLTNYLHGLYLVSDTTKSSAVFGYKAYDSTLMFRLYFHRPGLTTANLEYDFPLTNPSTQYNQISSSYGSLPLKKLKTQRDTLHSASSYGESYIQAGVGLMTRVDFPYMGSLFELPRKGKILSAELVIKAEIGSDDTIPLPDTLFLYATDKNNRVNGFLLANNQSYVFGIKHQDDIHLEYPVYYTFDVTNYLFSALNGNYYNTDNGILVGLRSGLFTTTLSRLIITGQGSVNEIPQLKIKYVLYD